MLLGWFAETTVVAAALAAVAALAGRIRPIGPTARHVLWLAVLVKMMTPPLVAWPWAVDWRALHWPSPSPGSPTASIGPVDRSPAVEAAGPDRAATPLPQSNAIRTVALALPVVDVPAPAPPPAVPRPSVTIAGILLVGWLAATGLLAAGQAGRILRFRRRLRLAVPAPDDLVDEAVRIAEQIGAPVPEILVIPELGSPMLWCLGRPRLLLPAPLVKTIDRARWRGILAHELAHLRRGDHWVSRLELIAGLLWWWNPLYWFTRSRLDAEAELACDAWVVWALPDDRLAYAETLFDIGSRLSRAVSPAPALGAAGPGHFLERRLSMILRDHVSCRLSPAFLLAAILLVVLAIPSWSAVTPAAEPPAVPAPILAAPDDQEASSASVDDADDDDDADVDDDADDDDARAKKKAEAKAKRDEARAKRDEARAKRLEEKAKVKGAEAKAKADSRKREADELGADFEKKMEAFGKEMEAKFGPGSDFEKQMEKLGKEMESKFGPGSDFEKQMKKLGKEMEGKFGPGSDFEKKMRLFGKEMESKFGPGSDFEKKMKAVGQQATEKAEAAARKGAEAREDMKRAQARAEKVKPKARAGAKGARREARLAALEAQIRKLTAELKALEAEEDEEKEDDER